MLTLATLLLLNTIVDIIHNIDDTSMLDVAAFINFDTIQYRDTKSSILQEWIKFKKKAIEERNNNAISELKIEGFELKN
ncbi:hypothetical protein ACE5D9_00205 [Rickettsia sp. 2024-CO-Wats]|uniref:hypothetical protein n=1 Tax=unclassified Rickettsia TaxID=114295 RepID=UPI00370D2548